MVEKGLPVSKPSAQAAEQGRQVTQQLNVQALEALEKANMTRVLRAADKRAVKLGDLDPTSILMDPPEYWQSAKLIDLLLSMNRIGRRRANRWCKIEAISPAQRLDHLTERQCRMLSAHIDLWSRRRDEVRLALEEGA